MDLRVIVLAKALLTLSPNVGHSIAVQSSLHGCQWGSPSGWSATAAEDTGQPSASHPQLCHCGGNTWISLYLAYISQCTTQYTWPTYLSVLFSILGLHISVYYSVYLPYISQCTTQYTWPTYLSVLLSILGLHISVYYSVYVACITQYTTHYIWSVYCILVLCHIKCFTKESPHFSPHFMGSIYLAPTPLMWTSAPPSLPPSLTSAVKLNYLHPSQCPPPSPPSSPTYGETSSGATSFPNCSAMSWLAMFATHCIARVLKTGLRDSRSWRMAWMISCRRSWVSPINTETKR